MKSFWILAVALLLASAVASGQSAAPPSQTQQPPSGSAGADAPGGGSTGSFESEPAQPAASGASAAAGTPAATGPGPGAQHGVGGPSGQPAAPVAATAAPASSAVDGATYKVRLRDLEARVDELKEQIRRSHTRLSLLSETILAGGVGGARAEIVLGNELSGAFRIVRVLVVVDGAVQYNKQDAEGALSEQGEIPVYTGSIPPGDHTLQVLLELKGHGYGVFSYLKGYEIDLKSSHAFTVTDGKTAQIKIVAWEKGGVTTPLEQRPAIRYVEKVRSGNQARSAGGR